jgi:hypothetical protein
MPKRTNLYLTDEAQGALSRLAEGSRSKFASSAIVRSFRQLAEARALVAATLTRDEVLAVLDATNGLFIIEGMAYADQVAGDVEDSETNHVTPEARKELAKRLYGDEGTSRALIVLRDAFFDGVDDLAWL